MPVGSKRLFWIRPVRLRVGQPEVTDIFVTDNKIDQTEILRLAASVEQGSEHPLGQALVAEAGNRNLVLEQPEGFRAEAGFGVTAAVGGFKFLLEIHA